MKDMNEQNYEKSLEARLDGMTTAEADVLLAEETDVAVRPAVKRRIKNAVQGRIRAEEKGRRYIHRPALVRRVAGYAAAFLVVTCAVGYISLPDAAAEALGDRIVTELREVVDSVKSLFTYVPGVGITEVTVPKQDPTQDAPEIFDVVTPGEFLFPSYLAGVDTICAADDSGDKARLIRTDYADGMIRLLVECDNRSVSPRAFSLYVNGKALHYGEKGMSFSTFNFSVRPADSSQNEYYTMMAVSYKMPEPAHGDRFEVSIEGYEGRLSTTSVLYTTFEQLEDIGPTVEKNGISLTVTSEWVDDMLVVWTTPFIRDPENTDTITNYGRPAYGIAQFFNDHAVVWNEIQAAAGDPEALDRLNQELESYIPCIHVLSRDVSVPTRPYRYSPQFNNLEEIGYDRYSLPTNAETATLTIPYIAMRRDEAYTVDIPLPSEYGTENTDQVIHTTLGEIRIVSVTRAAGEAGKDEISCTVELESAADKMYFYNFQYEVIAGETGKNINAGDGRDHKTLRPQIISFDVDPSETTVTLDITALDYFLMDEYTFDLDLSKRAE